MRNRGGGERTTAGQRDDEGTPATLAVAMAFSIVGGVVVAVSQVVDPPAVVVTVGVALLVLGLLTATVIGYLHARRTGEGFFRSLGQGVLTLVSWLGAALSF